MCTQENPMAVCELLSSMHGGVEVSYMYHSTSHNTIRTYTILELSPIIQAPTHPTPSIRKNSSDESFPILAEVAEQCLYPVSSSRLVSSRVIEKQINHCRRPIRCARGSTYDCGRRIRAVVGIGLVLSGRVLEEVPQLRGR